ncbi:MAG: ACP S-malonyltransferase [Gammaproteobacteria bacterium]|jgi:[acyl-carrier-protein] S-malonyltransferase|nr:ACP S-malonyltransferase [Gammaproteobacteria bacterium]MBT6044323.1 ACP S-malonyltransferase [Gammaproteobacteria bacterium]
MNPSHTGFIFPGQGSQKVGMLADLAEGHAQVIETFTLASDVLGYDLWALIQGGPEGDLAKTDIQQPAILTASVAIWQLWKAKGGFDPAIMAGHSLGEYSALTCAGVLSFTDAVGLVQKRGQYMQTTVPIGEGGMAAIVGLDDEKVVAACEQAKEDEEVAAVNFNSPGQVVISGHTKAVARASELCKEAGAKRALPLPVSAPFHSILMKPAAEKFFLDLKTVQFNPPEIPVIQNYGLESVSDPDKIRENLVSQIYNCVPWVDTINKFSNIGITQVAEFGPGRVLAGLNKRIQPEMAVMTVNDCASLQDALA